MLAWQFHQLLTALPNRGVVEDLLFTRKVPVNIAWCTSLLFSGGECGTWASCARELWKSSSLWGAATGGNGLLDDPLEEVLGDPTFLKGEGQPGRGVILSIRIRRALPVLSK